LSVEFLQHTWMTGALVILSARRLPAIGAFLALAGVLPVSQGSLTTGGHHQTPAAGDCVQAQTLNFSSTEMSATLKMWTPELMNAAEPFNLADIPLAGHNGKQADHESANPRPDGSLSTLCLPPPGSVSSQNAGTKNAAAARSATISPRSQPFGGYPTVGRLFFKVKDVKGAVDRYRTDIRLFGTAVTGIAALAVFRVAAPGGAAHSRLGSLPPPGGGRLCGWLLPGGAVPVNDHGLVGLGLADCPGIPG
jgi:hypothetical protein